MIQLTPQTRYTKFEHEYAFSLLKTGVDGDDCTYKKTFPVVGGVTMELCLAQFWSTLDASTVNVEISFHSILASTTSTIQPSFGIGSAAGGELLLSTASSGVSRLDVYCPIRREEIAPKITLNTLRSVVKSSDQSIAPLKSRDLLPDGKQLHELILTFTFKVTLFMTLFLIILHSIFLIATSKILLFKMFTPNL
jgi:tripeptidyl-peptidase-2